MRRMTGARFLALLVAIAGAALQQGCTGAPPERTAQMQPSQPAKAAANASERDCLIRAMYFESNRSSHDGLMAVGTVVMNRVHSPDYPNTVCGVVGQPRQFAPGVLTRAMNERELPPAERAADRVLKGERYAPAGEAMHFHMAGLDIPYQVRYVTTAGGNSFYLRTGRRARPSQKVVVAAAPAEASRTEVKEIPAAAPQANLFDKLYASLAGAAPATACETTNAAFGPSPSC
jgi:spore germination cell wall hydrolase CwlJ-like protein